MIFLGAPSQPLTSYTTSEGDCFGPHRCPLGQTHLGSLHFYLFLFLFFWSRVDLQCWVSFLCTARSISHAHIFIYPLSDSLQSTGLPVVYSSSLSVICFIYSTVYMLIPIYPLSLRPAGNREVVFYICDYFCFVSKFICTIFSLRLHI